MLNKKSIKRINKVLSYFLIFSVISIFSVYIIFFSNFVMPWERNEIIKTSLNWGGLNEFPKNAEIINIEKKGSMFTRQFIIEFKSSDKEINSWIEKSKRLKNNIPKIENQTKIYEIYPGEENAFGGKVEIKNNIVKINMSWS
ncbi:hypothetical protein IF125_10545 [Empedobacter stercoris]|uniref:hypothetical protein n=1 Tax=Empedobacter stercoris TaxID=1628248 RepID=UPI001CE1A08B|nr:hypothetical protein [Empedobacter stercoris]MCA4782691.1 hypothetical protein [Empedobacter stercoris]